MDNTLSIFKSMADKNRLRIVNALLVHDELCACQITEFLNVAGATASRHLSLMVNAGVLKNRKDGRWIYFRLNRDDTGLAPLIEWVKQEAAGSNQIRNDLKTLEKIACCPCEELSRRQREGPVLRRLNDKGR